MSFLTIIQPSLQYKAEVRCIGTHLCMCAVFNIYVYYTYIQIYIIQLFNSTNRFHSFFFVTNVNERKLNKFEREDFDNFWLLPKTDSIFFLFWASNCRRLPWKLDNRILLCGSIFTPPCLVMTQTLRAKYFVFQLQFNLILSNLSMKVCSEDIFRILTLKDTSLLQFIILQLILQKRERERSRDGKARYEGTHFLYGTPKITNSLNKN